MNIWLDALVIADTKEEILQKIKMTNKIIIFL